jgi:hypothetical protein
MKPIKFVLLAALLFFSCASLRAQVTIGGVENPKAGALLDLNGTAKGGLLLSNVSIEDFFKIPSSFYGGGNEDSSLKARLTGAMIYNTNPAFCIGIHVWNGQYWSRNVSQTPVLLPGITLSWTAENPEMILGGDEIEFTAAHSAKIYRWYASENSAPYKCIATTYTPTFSIEFPFGYYRVKVIMDDCHSLKESNEVSFTPGAISPSFGSSGGGNYIYLYGNFPYAASSDYAQNGLVSHYDGINNQASGDKSHDYNATSWKDLKTGFNLPKNGNGQWLSYGFQALSSTASFKNASSPDAYPKGNKERTVEVIFKTPDESNMFKQEQGTQRRIFAYGLNNATQMFGIQYRGTETDKLDLPDVCSTGNKWVFYAIFGFDYNLITCLSSTPSLETPNTINTVTSTYRNNMQDALTKSYINNIPATIAGIYNKDGSTSLNTKQGPLVIGENLSHSTFLSVRLYDRVLTGEEIAQNAALDQIRFLTPPTVTIGDKNCEEVVVLSPHFLMCKVPPGTSTGTQEVKLNGAYYTEYKYVDPVSSFYVSGISPIIGVAGATLTLTGNKLNEISEVRMGGVLCNVSGTPTSTTYECIIPVRSLGTNEVDITITLKDNNTIYRFAKVFEYH